MTFEKRFLLSYPEAKGKILLPEPVPNIDLIIPSTPTPVVRQDYYKKNKEYIAKNHVSKKPKEVKCESLILQKGNEVINKYSLFGELLLLNEPMLLPAFEKSLQDEAKNAIDCWSMIWRSHIISEIQDVLKEDYRFFMT